MRFKPSPKKILPRPLPFLKNRAIFPPLEVYMVNSPSWPNLRLLAPPALVDCGGMTPLWHRETCLPVHRPPVPNQTKSDHAHPLPARCSRGGIPDLRNPESVPHFPPIKAKNPAIVHHQGISRQTPKKPTPLGASPFHPLCDVATPHLCVKTPSSRHDQASIKAKNPAIKANRA